MVTEHGGGTTFASRQTGEGGGAGADGSVPESSSGASRWPQRARCRVVGRLVRAVGPERCELGMATAEYAIATVAAAGFAGLLLAILRSEEVRGLLLGIVRGALSV